MTPNQRKLLKAALAAVAITAIFPPFIVGFPEGGTIGIGHGFILSWPAPKFNGNLTGHVDVAMLIAEWIAIGIVSALLWVLFRPATAIGITGLLFLKTNRDADVQLESARIQADAIIRAAEIQSEKK